MVLVWCGLPAATEKRAYCPSNLSGFDMYVNRNRNWCADVVINVHTHNAHRAAVQEIIHMHAAAYPPGEARLEALCAFREPAPGKQHATGCRFPVVASFRGRKADLKIGTRRCLPTVWRHLAVPKKSSQKETQNKNPRQGFLEGATQP